VAGQLVKLYKRFDGYPAGVLDVLIPFVADFEANRGCNAFGYLLARMTMAFGEAEEKDRLRRLADLKRKDSIWFTKRNYNTGFGLGDTWHSDLKYAYVIDLKATIKVYAVSSGAGRRFLDNQAVFNGAAEGHAIPAELLATIPVGTTVEAALTLVEEAE